MRLIAGRSAEALTEAIARASGLRAERLRVERFANENLLCDASHLELRDADVAFVQTSAFPVSENLIETLLSLDAIRAARPRRLTAVLPYLPYARSDRAESAEGPIQARLVARLLETAGAERVVAVDLHSPQLAGFYRVPVREVSARRALCDAIRAWRLPDLAIASPDFGGAKRAAAVAAELGAPLLLFRKTRRGARVESECTGEVAGRSLVIFDDEIATGSTVLTAAAQARERGARSVCAAATHGVLAGDVLERCARAGIARVLLSDTLPARPAPAGIQLEVVSVAGELAAALTRAG
jgi:ribose-phosphate pyrophosphokinase